MERLRTEVCSTGTLARAMDLGGEPLGVLLKAEPEDEEEAAIHQEMQARFKVGV